MKCWIILASLVAICAVFFGVGHAAETAKLDDFEEQPFEDEEREKQLSDSVLNGEVDDDDDDEAEDDDNGNAVEMSENALESVNETPSDDENKRVVPWWAKARRHPRRRVPRRRRSVRRCRC